MGRKWGDVLCSTNDVTPLDAYFVSSFDIENFVGGGEAFVASDAGVVDVGDGVVG
jgi:hypothetical protein